MSVVEFKTQELTDLPAETYHGQEWAVSSTFLKNMFTHSPYYAMWQRGAHTDSPALRLGRAAHTLILEGEEVFSKEYEEKWWNGRTKEGKERTAAAEAAGRTLLTPGEYEAVIGMCEAVYSHEFAVSVLEDTPTRETSWFWQDEDMGVWCKARPDAVGAFTMCDLKTTSSIYSFERSAFKYAYPVQAAFYLRGWQAMRGETGTPDFPFIAVSTSAPYEVGVFHFDNDTLETADRLVGRLLAAYADYSVHMFTTGYEMPQTLTPTGWERDLMKTWKAA